MARRAVPNPARADEARWEFELVDLSRPVTLDTVDALFGDIVADGENAYFRDLAVDIVVDHDVAPAFICRVTLPEHIATHVDAPIHAVAGGDRLEQIDLRRLIGEAIVLDLDRAGSDYGYTADDLEQAGQDVRAGDIVLIYSGFTDTAPRERMRQTYLTASAAEWLVDRGVHAVGVEPCSPDPLYAALYEYGWTEKGSPNQPAWPAHTILLRHDVYIIEGLTNLDRIKGQRVRFCALPPLFPGLSGFPVRAVAWSEPHR